MMTPFRSVLAGFAVLATTCVASPVGGNLSSLPATGADFAVAATTDGSAEASASALSSTHDADNTTPRTAAGDDLLARAETHLNNGKSLYFQGNLPDARREFDAAVDTLLSAPDSLPDHRRLERRLDELSDVIYRFDLEKLGSGQQSTGDAIAFDKAPIDEISHMTFPVDASLASRLKSELTQTTAGIPLELADPVLSYVHFFSTDRGRSILLSGFRRSGRYREMIQRVFAEEGVPQDLIYLAQAESGFLPRAVSYKKAVGMWQFIEGTGAKYELTRTSLYDDRLDPEKATRAAARHLRDLYARYNDWYLAMAAYNCGAGNVDRAVERTGYADYWELLKRHALPKETASYVPIIIAMTIMAKNPQDYGLENMEADSPVEYETIHVTADTSLNLIADATLQPLSTLHDLNPSLLRSVAPAGFTVHVPKGSSEVALSAIESVPAANREAWRLHHVAAGDTLASIAKTYHLQADQILSVNNTADNIEAGDVLLIPAAYHPDPAPVSQRTHSAHSRTRKPAAVRSGTRVLASRHVTPQVLQRKAAVRTANLNR